jgi:hypothetical protein
MARAAARTPSRRAAHNPYGGRGSRTLVVVAALLVLIGVPALVVLLASGETVDGAGTATVAPASDDPFRPAAPFFAGVGDGVTPRGIGCSPRPETRVRARAHLDVLVDGRPVTVPAGVGVRPTCSYWVRTTAEDGIVTIGSPERRSFTLGDFFDIWGAPLTSGRLLTFDVNAGRPLRAFVDGRLREGDPRAIRLEDGREIALVLGRRPRTVPARFPSP